MYNVASLLLLLLFTSLVSCSDVGASPSSDHKQAPFAAAYYEFRPPYLNGLVWAVDTFFLLDILVNFCMPIQTPNKLITDRKQIALHYVSFLFWIHLLAAFPFDR